MAMLLMKSHIYLSNLWWSEHISTVHNKARKRLNSMQPQKLKLDRISLGTMYKSFVFPLMEYTLSVWGGTYDSDINKLKSIHVDAMRLISGATGRSNIRNLYIETAAILQGKT